MANESARRVLAVIPDLFFATKVAATAKPAGVPLELAQPRAAVARARESQPALVLVDLHVPEMAALVTGLRAAAPAAEIVGFYSHVETHIRDTALAAGASAAMPRSQFVTRLSALLERGLVSPA